MNYNRIIHDIHWIFNSQYIFLFESFFFISLLAVFCVASIYNLQSLNSKWVRWRHLCWFYVIQLSTIFLLVLLVSSSEACKTLKIIQKKVFFLSVECRYLHMLSIFTFYRTCYIRLNQLSISISMGSNAARQYSITICNTHLRKKTHTTAFPMEMLIWFVMIWYTENNREELSM